MTPTTRLATLLLLLPVPLLSCSDEEDPPPRSTTTTTLSPEAEVEAAYLAYWNMVDRLVADPDPENPQIGEMAVDPARQRLIDSLSGFQSAGHVARSGDLYAHVVTDVAVNGDTATLRDCAVDDSSLVEADSGEVVEQEVVTTSVEAVLIREGSAWLLKELNPIESWEGAVPCRE
jgi:hypothetical protein